MDPIVPFGRTGVKVQDDLAHHLAMLEVAVTLNRAECRFGSSLGKYTSRSGNQYLHRTSAEYRCQVRRKIDAYRRYVQISCIAQGLLQYLAMNFHTTVWRSLGSWLRTMNPHMPPSGAVVAQALRHTLPEFLVTDSDEGIFAKFLLQWADPDRSLVLPRAA